MPRPLIFRERPAKAAQFVRRRQRVPSATGALRITILETITSPIVALVSIPFAHTVAKYWR
jgi:hypothetical protein